MSEHSLEGATRWRSVRIRITALAMLVVAGSLALGSFTLIALLRDGLQRQVRTDAQVRAAEVAALAGKAVLPRPLPAVTGDWPTLLQVVEADGTVSTASAPLIGRPALLDPQARSRGHSTQVALVIPGGKGPWWAQAVPATLAGRSATVIVIASLAQPQRTVRLLQGLLGIGVPLLLGAAGVLTWATVGRALRPVERLRREVERLASGSAEGRRVTAAATGDEIERLARTLNRMLERVDQAELTQRQFVADASHELRGPVANIRTALEVALAHPERADWVAVSDDVLTQDERMGRLVDDLLLLARGDDDPSRLRVEEVDLSALVADLVARQPTDRVSIRIARSEVVRLHDDRVQLSSIVSNLLDNAVRFATSSVSVSVATTANWVELVVIDDGPGVAPEDRERIFDRFVRVDAHRSRQGGGAGLGLAIVAQLVSRRSGVVTVGDARPGAVFTVRLPTMQVPPRPTGVSGSS